MQDDELGRVAKVLEGHESVIFPAWVNAASSRLAGRMTAQELEGELHAVYSSIVNSGKDGSQDGLTETRAILAELSASRARQGFSPTETAVAVTSVKDAALPLVEEGTLRLDDFIAVSKLMDELGLVTFDNYVRAREQIIVDQTEQLLELSTPVLRLWEGIVAAPLVGTLDSARTQVVMEHLLQPLVDSRSEHAIIDITGVPAVDTQVAQHLMKTIAAARLMGAECLISGIRPQIAQTIVALGIEFGDIVTKATLADALEYCLGSSGVTLTRRTGGSD